MAYSETALACPLSSPAAGNALVGALTRPERHQRLDAERWTWGCGYSSTTAGRRVIWPAMANLELVALVVRDYDAAIRFFVDALQFELVKDTPSLTNDGRPSVGS
jgi:hypothetical protein